MTTTNNCAPLEAVDDFVIVFEEAARLGQADIGDFLPNRSDPLYSRVLRELIRIDMEFAWARGEQRRVEEYGKRFPMVLRDKEVLQDIAFEEYRQRSEHGEKPSIEEYKSRYGVDTS